MPKVIIGKSRNGYRFWVYTLFFNSTSDSFDRVYVSDHYCSGVDVVKGVIQSYNPRYTVYCISDNKGNVHYYHPRYRKWYKNLSQSSLRKYFFWLVPERDSNIISPDFTHSPARS